MAAVTFNAVRPINEIFWSIDAFINCQAFRCITTKFPLQYYNQVVLLSTYIDKRYLDFIYTDAEILLASWDSRSFAPVQFRETCHNLLRGESDVCAVILLCRSVRERLTCSLEMQLVLGALESWVTVQFLLLPSKREYRIHEITQLITEYDRLSDLLRKNAEENVRGNVIETVQMVTGTAAENTATIGIETTATSLGHAAAGVVLAVVVDLAVTASMLVRAKVRKDRGTITVRQYKREIRERLFQTGCQFVAGTTGTIVGQIVVPIPVVGAAIGGFMGSLVGLGVSLGISKIQKVAARAKRRKEMAMLENSKSN